ncbi:alanine dehydrogenase [Bryobacter aggregatus]|uniref:alanine dehydrogenase n=1 Tax=Bryobacter aggregatus TaxID=360054 RepID=UPI0004E23613|nr:alanine dehydrogenase [Bryobacter aggregatus]
MIIGVPKEIKDHETRVGLVPSGVTALVEHGHQVLIESGAGLGSSLTDEEYIEAGATVLPKASEVWAKAEIVVKVKEPQPSECEYFRPGLLLFTYLHLAPLPSLTSKLLKSRVNAVAYETIREADGSLPLLTPMSEVAGRMGVQIGAQYLEGPNGGRGILLGGIPGVAPANVVIIGGGVVGHHAAKIAVGLGAHVTIIDKNLNRLRELDDIYSSQVITLASNVYTVREALRTADLVIGAVLVPGASAPKIVRKDMVSKMKKGSVLVDVAIDQGGCFETSRPTTHTKPIFYVDGVLHYCVTNMPAAVPHTSTFGLTNATIPYLLQIADKGLEKACADAKPIAEGVNTYQGYIVYPGVGESQGREWRTLSSVV